MAGVGRHKGGGRQKGTPNKSKLPLLEKAKALGIDPFEVLLLFAKGDWKGLGYSNEFIVNISKFGETIRHTIEPSIRAKAASEAAGYMYPKLKSIEIKESPNDNRPLKDVSDEELDKM